MALIVGTENDTEIILEPSVSISHPSAITGGRFIPGAPVPYRTVTIQRFQTFYLQELMTQELEENQVFESLNHNPTSYRNIKNELVLV